MKLDPTITTALCKTIETTIRWALQYDPGSQIALGKLEGNVLAVESSNPELQLFFICHATHLQVLSYYEPVPDCRIQGSLGSLTELLWSEQDSLANSGVVLSGEIGFLLQLKKLIASLDIDWEEPLTQCLGDAIGHPLAELIRKQANWTRARTATLPSWISDFLVEEIRVTPSQTELENFHRNVDSLRSGTERLQAHIGLLRHTLIQRTQSGQK